MPVLTRRRRDVFSPESLRAPGLGATGSGGAVALPPEAPFAALTSLSTDNRPDFYIDLPWGYGDYRDAQAGDALVGQYQLQAGGAWTEYLRRTLSSGDISGDEWTQTGVNAVPDALYFFRWHLERGAAIGADSDNVSVLIAVIATLSSPTAAATGKFTASLGVTTNGIEGTLYWVLSTSATPPSAAQVKAGQMHTGAAAAASGSQAITASGAITITGGASGLTASTTYYAHFMHEQTAGMSSVSTSASITTQALATAPVVASAAGYVGINTTSSNITLPSGVVAGNLLVMLVNAYDQDINTPSGWTLLASQTTSGGHRAALFYRVATGVETTVTVTTGVATRLGARLLRITGQRASSMIECSAASHGNGSGPNPAAVTPSWGLENNMWVVFCGARSGGSATLVTGYPSTYSSNQAESGNANSAGCSASVATKEANATSDDPAAWTLAGAREYVTWTVAVRPA